MNKKRSRKRPQSPKSNRHALSNTEYIAAMRELRRSSAAQPHRNAAKYYRPVERQIGGDW